MALDATAAPNFIDNLQHAFHAGDPDVKSKKAEDVNVKLVQEMMRAIAANDPKAFALLLADDSELEILGPAEVPFVGRTRGKQKVVDTVWHNFSLLEEQVPEVVTVVAQGDTVVLVGRERGKVRETKQEYDYHFVQFHTFKDGKSTRVQQVVATTLPRT